MNLIRSTGATRVKQWHAKALACKNGVKERFREIFGASQRLA
jgi:hypothetical protein